MGNTKLMKPLFYGRSFNCSGHKMKAVFLKEVSSGEVTYRLWQKAGKPVHQYPQAENDTYCLYVEIKGYLVPLNLTEYRLIDLCGYLPAVTNLYGGMEQRHTCLAELRENSRPGDGAVNAFMERENEEIQRCGSDPAIQAEYIKAQMVGHVDAYLKARDNRGETFPDFIGALILDELAACEKLRDAHQQKRIVKYEEEHQAQRAKDQKIVQDGQKETDRQIALALDTLRHGGKLKNDEVKVYTLTPDSYTISKYSIVNYLMRQFNINVPLRTQGWINNKLANVTIQDGRCQNLQYYRAKGAQCSQKFFECMNELILAVQGSVTGEQQNCSGD